MNDAMRTFVAIVAAGLILLAAWTFISRSGVAEPQRTTTVQHKRDPTPPRPSAEPCFNGGTRMPGGWCRPDW